MRITEQDVLLRKPLAVRLQLGWVICGRLLSTCGAIYNCLNAAAKQEYELAAEIKSW